MEGIREQLVKKPVTGSDRAKTYGVLAAALLVAVIVFMLVNIFLGSTMVIVAIILAGVILWGGYWLTGEFNVEYEYCFSAGELTVDKIINQKRRKPMCSIDLRSADSFTKSPRKLPDVTVINACGDSGEQYAIEYTDTKYGRCVFLFTPDERMLEAVKPYLPRML